MPGPVIKSRQLTLGIILLALAACGGDVDAPAPEQEQPAEQPQSERAEIEVRPRGAALDARCGKVVRDTGVRMRMPARRARETFRSYERRVRRAVADMGRVYRMLYARLKDTPGTQDQKRYEPFQIFLSSVESTAWQFEQVAGYRNRNPIELRGALTYPAKQYVQLAREAEALDAPSCAPQPGSTPLG